MADLVAPDLRQIDGLPDNKTQEVFVSRVVRYSSQYNNQGWSASRIEGEPRVYPRYGDIQGCWAQGVCDGAQYIEVEFPNSLYIERIDIYETLNGGAITAIKALSPSDGMVTIFTDNNAPTVITNSRIFTPDIDVPDFPCSVLRIEVDCTAAGSWCELDAIKLVGRTVNIEMPSVASLSAQLYSLYNSSDYSDVQFRVCTQTVYAHKAILAARSHYFRAMFGSGMRESKDSEPIVIEGVSRAAFLGLLQYFYTNTLAKDIKPLSMMELIRVGDRFSADGLDALCHWFISEELDQDNVIALYRSAVEGVPALDAIRDMCMGYITSHMEMMSRRRDFAQLTHAQMLEIIQHGAAKMSV